MKALCWHGKGDVRIDDVPEPKILDDGDAIIKVRATAICGSDLHIVNGYVPNMEQGDILGHEFMGEVVEVGALNDKLKVGDRVVVPFTIACGNCFFCQKELFSLCDRSNPNAEFAKKKMGQSPSAIFGYSHLLGGIPGGQAEYVRVPYAAVGALKVPDHLTDEQVLFLSDILPTGYMAVENCRVAPGDTVAIWGAGPVGQFAIQCAWMFGAGRVIVIDYIPERLKMAEQNGKAEIINFDKERVFDRLMTMTNGRGPDRCIDAVGTEAHAAGSMDGMLDNFKTTFFMGTDRSHVLREAIMCCRKGGYVSIPGVYLGKLDSIPFGSAMNKGLTLKMGQTHVQRYLPLLLEKIEAGEIDPTFVITHRMKLDDAPHAYELFNDKKDGCIKVVLTP